MSGDMIQIFLIQAVFDLSLGQKLAGKRTSVPNSGGMWIFFESNYGSGFSSHNKSGLFFTELFCFDIFCCCSLD